jgi:hypothetical protein
VLALGISRHSHGVRAEGASGESGGRLVHRAAT